MVVVRILEQTATVVSDSDDAPTRTIVLMTHCALGIGHAMHSSALVDIESRAECDRVSTYPPTSGPRPSASTQHPRAMNGDNPRLNALKYEHTHLLNQESERRNQMKALVVYDSAYGSTEKVAKAIGDAIGGDTRVVRGSDVNISDVDAIDLLIVGSPTYGGKATQPIQDLLARIPEGAIKGMRVAAFDTRLTGRFVKMFGFAADKISDDLRARGARAVYTPEGFFVKGKKGPLKEGELERAANWAREISK
jgi:flavodoxin I